MSSARPGAGMSVGAWAAALRVEYLAARDAVIASGGSPDSSAPLRKVVSRYLHAFSAAGSAEARKSHDFFDLQVDEARVAMCVPLRRRLLLGRTAPPPRRARLRAAAARREARRDAPPRAQRAAPASSPVLRYLFLSLPPRAQANRRRARAHAVQVAEEHDLGAHRVGALAPVLHFRGSAR